MLEGGAPELKMMGYHINRFTVEPTERSDAQLLQN